MNTALLSRPSAVFALIRSVVAHIWNDWDHANTSSVGLSPSTYDSQGRWDAQTITNDDNTRTVNDWDRLATNQAVLRVRA
jgi:hypothetical protein